MNPKETKAIKDTLVDDDGELYILWRELSMLGELAKETKSVQEHALIANTMCNIAKTILKIQWQSAS